MAAWVVRMPDGSEAVLQVGEELALGRSRHGVDDGRCSRAQALLKGEQEGVRLLWKGRNPGRLHDGSELRQDCPPPLLEPGHSFTLLSDKYEYSVLQPPRSAEKRSREDEEEEPLPPCPYGAKCFRKNAVHRAEFAHPQREEEEGLKTTTTTRTIVTPKVQDVPQETEPKRSKREEMPPPAPVPPSSSLSSSSATASGSPVSQTDSGGEEVMKVGKHKGRRFIDLVREEPSYAAWALAQQAASGPLAAFQRYVRRSSPLLSSPSPSSSSSSSSSSSLAQEWASQLTTAPLSDSLPEAQAAVRPQRRAWGVAPSAPPAWAQVPAVPGLAPRLLMPLLSASSSLACPPLVALRALGTVLRPWLVAHSESNVELTVLLPPAALALSKAELQTALFGPPPARQDPRLVLAPGDSLAAWLQSCSAAARPSFALLDATWRLQVVPRAPGASLLPLLAGGKSAFRELARDALQGTGETAAEVGRAYAIGPIMDPSVWTPGARLNDVVSLKFLIACCSPNCNAQRADPVEPDEAETLLCSTYESALDAFWKAYLKYES